MITFGNDILVLFPTDIILVLVQSDANYGEKVVCFRIWQGKGWQPALSTSFISQQRNSWGSSIMGIWVIVNMQWAIEREDSFFKKPTLPRFLFNQPTDKELTDLNPIISKRHDGCKIKVGRLQGYYIKQSRESPSKLSSKFPLFLCLGWTSWAFSKILAAILSEMRETPSLKNCSLNLVSSSFDRPTPIVFHSPKPPLHV